MPEELVINAAGRYVPAEVNGRPEVPYQGVRAYRPDGRHVAPPIRTAVDYPVDGDKRVADLREVLVRAGARDGMCLSTHHHFRNGDLVANALFEAAAELGLKDLVWFPSSVFPCHEPIIGHMERGTVHHIEAGLNGTVGAWVSRGNMRGTGVVRSHGGRSLAIKGGERPIDLAVIAAPAADVFGNANGVGGPNRCGPLGFSKPDARYADRVAVVTDHLVDFPCLPWEIDGKHVDHVVETERVGDPAKIVFGTTRVTEDPTRLRIARLAAEFARAAGIVRDGWSFQAGASSVALAINGFLVEMMRDMGIRARFVQAGSTFQTVQMLREGLVDFVIDGQSFDMEGIDSLRDDPRHVATSAFTAYDFHTKGDFMGMVDAVFLGATEVDLDFNANVATHSDGQLLHGVGGWQQCLGSKCTVLTVPSARRRGSILVDRVTTLCGPGELVDVVVTERGIAINPRREDLREAVRGAGLPLMELAAMKAAAEAEFGTVAAPALGDEVVAVVKWIDGTLIDSVRRVI